MSQRGTRRFARESSEATMDLGTAVALVSLPVLVPYLAVDMVVDAFTDHDAKRKREQLQETRALWEAAKAAMAASPIGKASVDKIKHAIFVDAIGQAEVSTLCDDVLIPCLEASDFLMAEEGLYGLPDIDWSEPMDLETGVLLRNYLRKQKRFFSDWEHRFDLWTTAIIDMFAEIFERLPASVFHDDNEDDDKDIATALTFQMPLIDLVEDPAYLVERILRTFAGDDDLRKAKLFEDLREHLYANVLRASGIEPKDRYRTNKRFIYPSKAQGKPPVELVEEYLGGTPFEYVLLQPMPFTFPLNARFEHQHIIAGTGHGKTQLLQLLIHHDLEQAREGNGSLVVIDSQGDLIKKIAHLAYFSPLADNSLADKFMLIDPNDIQHPVALNMFDVNMERINSYDPVERAKILNGTIALYSYIFGALLGAELTQKQGVIFNYLARLMLVIPNATVHTLMELMEDGEPFRPYMDKLDGTTRKFFHSQFFDKNFDQTKKQILNRLWGVLGNETFEQMFGNPHNKIDLFDAMNSGKIILINTAKDLLEEEGSQIFGRFFIAMIAQAAMQRAVIPENRRRATFVYIDEAHEYFDDNIENILNQARKYKIGLIASHQNLDQLLPKLKASMMTSTTIKMAGGVSAKDARALASEMNCEPDFLQNMRKRETRRETDFACFIKNHTPQAMKLTVPLGYFEELPKLSDDEYNMLIAKNRKRYCVMSGQETEAPEAPKSTQGFELGDPELL